MCVREREKERNCGCRCATHVFVSESIGQRRLTFFSWRGEALTRRLSKWATFKKSLSFGHHPRSCLHSLSIMLRTRSLNLVTMNAQPWKVGVTGMRTCRTHSVCRCLWLDAETCPLMLKIGVLCPEPSLKLGKLVFSDQHMLNLSKQ